MVAMRRGRRAAAAVRSPATWTASSRVGATIRACGAPAVPLASRPSQPGSPGPMARCSAGMPKPRVLPVPVLAWPMMSWPPRATGRVMAWMGKGWTMPLASRASTIAGCTPKSAKVCSGATGAASSVTMSSAIAATVGSRSAEAGVCSEFWVMATRVPGRASSRRAEGPAPPCARFKRKPIARQARGAADGRRPVEPGRARRARRAVPDPAGHGAVPGVRGAGGGSG